MTFLLLTIMFIEQIDEFVDLASCPMRDSEAFLANYENVIPIEFAALCRGL